jgi:hypothetical protein
MFYDHLAFRTAASPHGNICRSRSWSSSACLPGSQLNSPSLPQIWVAGRDDRVSPILPQGRSAGLARAVSRKVAKTTPSTQASSFTGANLKSVAPHAAAGLNIRRSSCVRHPASATRCIGARRQQRREPPTPTAGEVACCAGRGERLPLAAGVGSSQPSGHALRRRRPSIIK